jgi:hypothetical protein
MAFPASLSLTVFRLQQVVGDMLKILVADAVIVESDSTPKFLAHRDNNREFRQIRPLCGILNADTRAISKAFGQITYATEKRII